MRKSSLISAAEKFQECLLPKVLADAGRRAGFSHRIRKITPDRLVPSLLSSLATGKVESLAELHRDFEKDHAISVNYKLYYERLDSDGFATLIQDIAHKACVARRSRVLSAETSRPLKIFEDIIIHDGTSFALRDGLSDVFPGRFTDKSPAAVELHVSMSLFSDNFTRVAVAPD